MKNVKKEEKSKERKKEKQKKGRKIVAKALDGQRYPLPL